MSTLIRILITLIPTAALVYARRFLPVDLGTIKVAAFPLADLLAALVFFLLIWFCRWMDLKKHFQQNARPKLWQGQSEKV